MMTRGWSKLRPHQAGQEALTRPIRGVRRDCWLAEILAGVFIFCAIAFALVLVAIPMLFAAWFVMEGWYVAAAMVGSL